MASDQKFVDFICEQMSGAGPLSARKMFGEFAIYRADQVVALVCDNQLFVKPTAGGKALLGEPALGAAYPGAKPHFLLDESLDDRELLAQLITITAKELPVPKAKSRSPRAARKPKTATRALKAKKPARR
jgi:TfoX/Sxy family transcriptional regulator of competence genes